MDLIIVVHHFTATVLAADIKAWRIVMNRRRLFLIFAFLTVLIMTAVTAVAEQGGEDGSSREWKTDIRLSITRENQLMQDAGMNLDAWDAAVDQAKQSGLSDAISKEAILEEDEDAVVLEEDGLIYQIGSCSLFGPVTNPLEAYRLAYRLVDLLGGSSLTDLYLRSKLTINEKTVYSFQQVSDAEEVLGGTLKIALDGENEVTAVFSCIDPEEDHEQKLISRQEAEALAAASCEENRMDAEVLGEYTDRIFRSPCTMKLVMNLDVDLDPIPDQLVWVVYTLNHETEKSDQTEMDQTGMEQTEMETAENYPYIAHYIRVDGTYLCSLPVRDPGDEEARFGYRKQDVFIGLEKDTYTGEITDVNGTVRTVTVPVMRSEADGCWYLGDVERRIAFADYYEAAYGENHDLVLIRSENNTDWDSEDIYIFYNYLRAYDFYADMGWIGPDGEGTDEIIFKGMCYSSGNVYDNAGSLGRLECWQCFSYAPYSESGDPTGLGWALDVMAHEYTHTFTGTVMNQNLYENDLGAINEAMSDILGNLVEYICQDTDDETWMIGENTGAPLRRMADPETFGQPMSVWGLFYVPTTDSPNTVNDRGGVHYNSSLLNLIGSKLCTEYGMSYEDAVSFWIMTAMGMTPRTDYSRMGALLRWALEQTGCSEAYQETLSQLIEETRIDTTLLPEELPEGEKMVRLVLPDTETFENKEWCLYITQMDIKTKAELTKDLLELVKQLVKDPEKRKAFTDSAKHLMENLELKKSELGVPKLVIRSDDPEQEDVLGDLLGKLLDQTRSELIKSETVLFSWEEMDTGVIPVVIEDKPTIYILMNISNGGSQLNRMVYLLGDSWYDLTDFMMNDAYNSDESVKEKLVTLSKTLGKQALTNFSDVIRNRSGKETEENAGSIPVEYLPTTGLENIRLDKSETQ
jgi:hypothetical protein